jgi:hypothetical protein
VLVRKNQTKYHFNPKKFRPALCGYCFLPAQSPRLLINNDSIYGCCCKEHLELIREGKKLKRVAVACDEGIEHTIAASKQSYIDISKKNKSYVLHEWSREDRELFYLRIVDAYLTWANEQARTGKLEKVIEDGSI